MHLNTNTWAQESLQSNLKEKKSSHKHLISRSLITIELYELLRSRMSTVIE